MKRKLLGSDHCNKGYPLSGVVKGGDYGPAVAYMMAAPDVSGVGPGAVGFSGQGVDAQKLPMIS
jgi:hypothetical protein